MAETTEKDAAVMNSDIQNGEFSIQKIYMKDTSFESPHSPDIFADEWSPEINMQLSNEATLISEEFKDLYEVVLTVTITVKVGEKTAYLIEVHQAGIFHIKNFPEDVVSHMVATVCPNILFPFVREAIADMVARGGFPQFLLAPVNFEAVYLQQQKQNEELDNKDVPETRH